MRQICVNRYRYVSCVGGLVLLATTGFAQKDPGPRPDPPAAGGPLSAMKSDSNLMAAFQTASDKFKEVEAVADGLGPRFNSNSCSSCHAQPAVGGTSPGPGGITTPATNPQVQFANANNPLPPFITANGPVREVRFIRKPDGTPDGGVHNLFTIMGHSDAPAGCVLAPENFSNASNIIFRIPTPLYGLGLIEAIPDHILVQNVANSASKSLGIQGVLNRNGNDGTVTRFGWKAQNKSLLLFAGEAYNVEMGITNFIFNTERDETPNCSPTPPPNSLFNIGGFTDSAVFDDINDFANFMRFLAPAAPGPIDSTVTRGSQLFVNIGCANCHTTTFTTGASPFAALANQEIHPYSDFALHHMGPGLADHISQGLASGDQFRTAPLWGLGQRLFFLHDGRTSDLFLAILDHRSGITAGQPGSIFTRLLFPPSEANEVIENFVTLSTSDKQAILNFLRSLKSSSATPFPSLDDPRMILGCNASLCFDSKERYALSTPVFFAHPRLVPMVANLKPTPGSRNPIARIVGPKIGARPDACSVGSRTETDADIAEDFNVGGRGHRACPKKGGWSIRGR